MEAVKTALETLLAAIDAEGLGTRSGDRWNTFRHSVVMMLRFVNPGGNYN